MARKINGAIYDCYSYPALGIDTKKYYYYVLKEGERRPDLSVDNINDMIDNFNNFLKKFYVPWHDSVRKSIDKGLENKTMPEEVAEKTLFALETKFPKLVEAVQQEVEKGDIYVDFRVFNPKSPEAYNFSDMNKFFASIYEEFCTKSVNQESTREIMGTQHIEEFDNQNVNSPVIEMCNFSEQEL